MIGIFDGDCGICSAFANFASARAGNCPLVLRPAHEFTEAELARYGITYDDCILAFQLVDDELGIRISEGGPAIRRTLAIIGGLPGALATVVDYLPPLLLAEPFVYRFIASHRTQISRMLGLTACRIRS